MAITMDPTLAAILSHLYQLTIENQNLKAENQRLQQVIDSQLPVHDGTMADLEAGEVVGRKRS